MDSDLKLFSIKALLSSREKWENLIKMWTKEEVKLKDKINAAYHNLYL